MTRGQRERERERERQGRQADRQRMYLDKEEFIHTTVASPNGYGRPNLHGFLGAEED